MEFTAEGGLLTCEYGKGGCWAVFIPWVVGHERFESDHGTPPSSKEELRVWMASRDIDYGQMIEKRVTGQSDMVWTDDPRVTAVRTGE